MRKRIVFVSMLVLVLFLCVAVSFLSSRSNSKGEIEAEAFEIINGRPFMIQEGEAYCWTEDKHWEHYRDENNLIQLYRGESFCALDSEGFVICEDYLDMDSQEEQIQMPLGSGSVFYRKNRMLELNQDYTFKTINRHPLYEDCRVLLENHEVMVGMGSDYATFSIEGEVIVDISGNFVLTESGRVYAGVIHDRTVARDGNVVYEPWLSWKQMDSDKKIITIQAHETNPNCVGICEDGTVVMWRTAGDSLLNLSDWKNVSEVSVGFYYVVGLTLNGTVLYADYDEGREARVKEILQKKKGVIGIASAYDEIALLYSDGSAEMIDLNEI